MAEVREDLRYTGEHEWVRADAQNAATVRVGITDYAQQSLGDIVFVQLPDTGTAVDAGSAVGEIESTKSVSDIYAPVSGTVTARNDALENTPELLNTSPFEDGWLFEVEVTDTAELDTLLDSDAYRQHTE